MKKYTERMTLLSALVMSALSVTAESLPYEWRTLPHSVRFRLELKDKAHSPYSIQKPEKFLSQKAIERRQRLGVKIDDHDLPVSPYYLKILRDKGFKIFNTSKWVNTVVVETPDSARIEELKKMPFVVSTKWVWSSPSKERVVDYSNRILLCKDTIIEKKKEESRYYGYAQRQAEMIGVDALHREGFKGKGMTIAIIDGGFFNADIVPGLKGVNILGTRNFVHPGKSVYENLSHGMNVLSTMAANTPYSFVGTAPEASYYLLLSEDGATEQLVEEDNYVAALEYADSIGADVVTASLGYYHFEYPSMSHTYSELNGHEAINSKAASLAAGRGILLLNSAGNEGNDTWKKIAFPADAEDILTVGAVDRVGINSYFSSLGYTSDHRVKPDAMAMGEAAAVYEGNGKIDFVNGTSFSCPIMAGAVACLWQAFPMKSPKEIIRAVQRCGDRYVAPNEVYGYGIPNLFEAYKTLKK